MQESAEAAQGSAGDETHDTDPTELNSTASGGMPESEESAEEPEMLPDSWETMAEEVAGHESAQESAGMVHIERATSAAAVTAVHVQSHRVGLRANPNSDARGHSV